jgi:hypothetical protein
MDAKQMTYRDQYFDWIFDKSALDSILCSEEGFMDACKMLFEGLIFHLPIVQRVLKVGGLY